MSHHQHIKGLRNDIYKKKIKPPNKTQQRNPLKPIYFYPANRK